MSTTTKRYMVIVSYASYVIDCFTDEADGVRKYMERMDFFPRTDTVRQNLIGPWDSSYDFDATVVPA